MCWWLEAISGKSQLGTCGTWVWPMHGVWCHCQISPFGNLQHGFPLHHLPSQTLRACLQWRCSTPHTPLPLSPWNNAGWVLTGWDLAMQHRCVLSQTQVLLIKIVKLCSEIRNIKNSQNKYYLKEKGNTKDNTVNLSKINDIHRSHNPVSLDICAYHDQHGDNSSCSTPKSPSRPACRKGTVLLCEPLPSHTVGIGVFSHLENVGNMSWLGQIFPGYSNQENCWIIYCAY